ncbi:MAG: NAD(P)/FAD-dependent oxidoreductase [Acidimicrobiia bacterium]
MQRFDVIVIGGGIAGVSVGHFLTEQRRSVLLVEAEAALAHHTTGRSAALYFENYGHMSIRSLSKASRRFFESPPAALADGPFLSPRGALTIARPEQSEHFEQVVADGAATGTTVHRLSPAEAGGIVPALRTERLVGALWEPGAADMDVAAIHQAFVRGMRRNDGEIRTASPVTALQRTGRGWVVTTPGFTAECAVVVNAAGAWCDMVAALADIAPVGLVPKRRTAFMVPGTESWSGWPLVVDVDHDFYFKPDGVQLLCSLADETPSDPCDARPEELDIALAIDRINDATTLGIRSVRSSWAGLRSFVPDGSMVIGFDPDAPGFFWLTGQGGTGIQTAPGAGTLAAGLICNGAVPSELGEFGVDAGLLAVRR